MEKEGLLNAIGLSDDQAEMLALLLAEEELAPASRPPIARRDPAAVVPISPAQRRLWFLQQLEPSSAAYNIPCAVRLHGRLDAPALARALGAIVQRHEALRTTFAPAEGGHDGDGQPTQRVAPALVLELPIVDLRAVPEAKREAEALRWARAEVSRPFDLERGPLIRAALLRLEETEHVLVLSIHHIVSDGWSRDVLVREAGALYAAFIADKPSPLPELPIQYGDFTLWQREHQRETWDAQLAYWKERLAGAPALDLPTDRPRPAIQTSRGATRTLVLPGDLSRALEALSRREGATMFMTLLAVFMILLHRYTGQTDLVVGSPAAGRKPIDVEPLIGLFVNTLVLRASVVPGASFRELLGHVRAACMDAYANQDLPFEQVVDALTLARDRSRSPIFQVLFDYQEVPLRALSLPDLSLEPIEIDNGAAKLDLELDAWSAPDGLRCSFNYNTDLFDAETIARIAHHFEVLLAAIVADPERPVRALPLLGPEERRRLLVEWNATERHYPEPHVLPALIEATAARSPDAVALMYEGASLTYAALNARANRLAHHLRRLGVGPEVAVGVCMERSLELLIGLLGILKAGGAYVPLDPSYPAERLGFMIDDAGIRVLLAHASTEGALPPSRAHLVRLDADLGALAAESDADPVALVSPDNLAYIIYTSGSTGRPKGVQIDHRGICNRLLWMQEVYGLTPADRVLQKTPFSFDVSVWELFWPLLVGARMVIARPGGHKDAAYLAELIAAEEITTIHFVPTMLSAFVEEPSAARCPSLRRVFCSGEALSVECQTRFFERMVAELHNLYGPTEASVDVSFWACERGVATHNVPIGRPIANTQLYILDADLSPVPIGVAGELHIGGVGLARGYVGRPALTAEKFVTDPYGARPGGRLYKTGDLARHRSDGAIEYLGRIDHQVKIRGFRIELGEIEETLLGHPGVREAVVVAQEEPSGGKCLVAYLVAEGGAAPGRDDLRRALKERLPKYMIPAVFVQLEALPRLSSGKIDRRALPASAPSTSAPATLAAPRTPMEQALASIWAEVLGVGAVGIHDNFFLCGGDSIRSIRVAAIARERGIHLSLPQLFEHQTIAELAAALGASEGHAEEARLAPFGLLSEADRRKLPPDVEDAYPLATLQRGMLYHLALEPGSRLYHNVDTFHLRAQLDLERLQEAVDRLVARHPVLRTGFEFGAFDEPLQLVHRAAHAPLEVVDLRGLSAGEQRAALEAWIEQEKTRHFDIGKPPLIRFQVHRYGEGSFQFSVPHHHAILDGWSIGSLCVELLTDYLASLRGNASTPAPTSLYRDFVALERRAMASDAARSFWATKLREHPFTPLPRWAERPPRAASQYMELPVPIPPDVVGGLRRLSREAGAPLKSVLLAAHLEAMRLLSGQPDVMTGIVANGREETRDGDRVLGLFLNTVPLGARLPDGTWVDLVREALRAERELLPFRRYPMAELQKQQGRALFEAMFNFTNFHIASGVERLEGLEIVEASSFTRQSFPLAANFDLDPSNAERLSLTLAYDAAEISDPQAEEIGGYYRRILDAMTRASGSRRDPGALLSDAERQKLVRAWNDTALDFPRDACIHELFEAQAARCPDAVAVVFGERELTYGELNRSANRLAHHLRSLGVGPEVRVGICVERSMEMVIGLWAILKAGGAYVPLDPGYPEERLTLLLADARAPVLLTSRSLAEKLPQHGATLVLLDAPLADARGEDPPRVARPENVAYVIYTSGSTGRPKGVLIMHANVVAFSSWARRAFAADDLAGVLAATSICFDLSVFELLTTLCCGGRVILASSALELPDLPRAGEVRLLNTVPSAMAALLRSGRLPTSIRTVNLAGEPLSEALAAQVHALPHVERLFNLYGPSETTTYSTWTAVPRGDRPAIGRPIGNTQVYVLDPGLSLVPIGVTGELYIGGDGVARGYLDQPRLTAERFLPDPFRAEPGARLYRTGDLARFRAGGELEFLGRRDDQVKIRGYRIELGEIEAALLQQPAVRDAVVMAREDTPGDRRLVAYVVLEAGQEASTRALRERLQAKLPLFMVPSTFVVLASLPLTPNGKVNRRALPAPEAMTPEASEGAAVAPRTPTEESLAGIWSAVLGRPPASIHDDFFALGGHSLLAMQVVARIRRTLGVELPLRKLHEAPTLAALAAEVEAARRGGAAAQGGALVAAPRIGDPPLSFAQQRLWFLDQLEPGSALYVMPMAMRLQGAVDVEALRHAFAEVVQRHEALRTTISEREGEAVQVIHPPPEAWKLEVVDLSSLPERARARAVERRLEEEAGRPFDMHAGPLLRTTLLRLGVADCVLLVTMHHIVSDGWSMGVFIREVMAHHEARVAGRPAALPPLPLQYADYAHWQRQRMGGRVGKAQLAYWKERLAGAPFALELPTDRPRPAVQSHRGAAEPVALDAALTDALRTLGQREGATLFMTLLTAFALVLSRYSGQRDLVIGTPVAGRTHVELEGLIGFFVNTLALRLDLDGAPSMSALLGRAREAALGAYAHQDLPFEHLVAALQLRPDRSRSPLFQVMFALQSTSVGRLALEGVTLEPLPAKTTTAKFDLTLALEETAEGLRGALEYSADLFDASTARRMVGHFETILRGMVAHPESTAAELPLLTAAERRELAAWNETAKDFGRRVPVHRLFAEQAALAPEAVAVVFEGQSLTYGELNRRANRFAHRLRAEGLGPEVLVGVCAERSLELVVGLLGILKAGAAYVPLDPSYPDDFLRLMIEDVRAPVLLTQTRLRDRLPPAGARVICLDDPSEVAGEREDEPEVAVCDEGLAYVIYTSGSTGRPKGAMNTHGGLRNRLLWMQEAYGLGSDDVVLQKTPYSFDVSVWEFFWPLITGARLVVARPGGHRDSAYLAELVAAQGVTTIHFVPSMLQAFVEEPGLDACHTLRRVIASGEALPFDLAERFLARSSAELHNLYGPTEASIDVTSWACQRGDARRLVPIGRPIANSRLHVLDERLEPVPVGVPGELYIGGVPLARGYLARPALTAERFIPDPTGVAPGGRLYRTGDLARWLPDGALEYLGRIDHQIKLRGHRIELGEIEAVMAQHPGVQQAVVVARERAPGDTRLVAYFTRNEHACSADPRGLAEDLRRLLEERLPRHMVPSAFVPLAAFPLTSSGKVDRKALPAITEGGAQQRAGGLVPARDTWELALTRIWEDLLGVRPIGVTDDFFALGGHSLLALGMISRVRWELGRDLALATLFERATIEELAGALRRSPARGASSPLVGIRTGGARRPLHCVHPAGGNVLCYAELARCLGPEQPFYALQALGLSGDEAPLGQIEDMAARYIDALRAVQPEGPYALGGWSLGGVIAFEMAQQLRARGEQIALLALIDSGAPRSDAAMPQDEALFMAQFAWDLGMLFGLPLDVSAEALAALPAQDRLEHVLSRAMTHGALPKGADLADMRRLSRVFEANLRAVERYAPKAYPGRIDFLQAVEHLADARPELIEGWRPLALGGVVRHEVPGNHYSIMRSPHVEALSAILKELMPS
jgi:amino acid adenylation domain-containing protein